MPLINYPQNTLTDMLYDTLISGSRDIGPVLRENICCYPLYIRRHIVSQYRDETTPLFMAVSGGLSTHVIKFLIQDCNADVEQKCRLRIQDNEGVTFSTHTVTAFWCACIKGNLNHVALLAEIGKAKINTPSDSGSTPIRSACFMNKVDIVRYLIKAGADVNRPNFNGGTCLINSIQNVELCTLLLNSNAEVDAQDMHGKTAAHYTIQENRLDTLKILIENGGADVHVENCFGDNLIQTAALNAAIDAFDYLYPKYPIEYILDQYDLLGAGILEKFHDLSAAVHYWDYSLNLRQDLGIFKTKLPRHSLKEYFGMEEIELSMELEEIRSNSETIHLQALLMYERVLGPNHRETIFRLLYRGAVYADQLEFQKCLYLWIYVYEVKLVHDVIYNPDTVFTCRTICIVMMEMAEKYSRGQTTDQLKLAHLIRIVIPIEASLPLAMACLRTRPRSLIQANFFRKGLLNLLYLLHASAFASTTDDARPLPNSTIPSAESEDFTFKRLLYQIVRENPVVSDGSTLLHLSIDNTSFLYYHPMSIIPSLKVVRLLTEVGADVNAQNESLDTPLHLVSGAIAVPHYYVTVQIMKTLLRKGAHYDTKNASGQVAGRVVPREPVTYELRNVNLKCLASRVIRRLPGVYASFKAHGYPQNMLSYVNNH